MGQDSTAGMGNRCYIIRVCVLQLPKASTRLAATSAHASLHLHTMQLRTSATCVLPTCSIVSFVFLSAFHIRRRPFHVFQTASTVDSSSHRLAPPPQHATRAQLGDDTCTRCVALTAAQDHTDLRSFSLLIY